VAVEPEILNFLILQQNIVKYRYFNVVPIFAGIGRETGKGRLSVGGWNAHSTVLSGYRFRGYRPTLIISWDDLMTAMHIQHVHLAKVNVEGAEIECLEGMNTVYPDKIMIDDHYRFGTDSKHLERLLRDRGYEILERRSSDPPESVNNLIYAKRT